MPLKRRPASKTRIEEFQLWPKDKPAPEGWETVTEAEGMGHHGERAKLIMRSLDSAIRKARES